MSTRATAKRQSTVADGRKLAVELLRTLEDTEDVHDKNGLPLWGIYMYDAYIKDPGDPDHHLRRAPQRNIVREYVDRARGDDAVLEGFCSVLTDYLACAASATGQPNLRQFLREPFELPKR